MRMQSVLCLMVSPSHFCHKKVSNNHRFDALALGQWECHLCSAFTKSLFRVVTKKFANGICWTMASFKLLSLLKKPWAMKVACLMVSPTIFSWKESLALLKLNTNCNLGPLVRPYLLSSIIDNDWKTLSDFGSSEKTFKICFCSCSNHWRNSPFFSSISL